LNAELPEKLMASAYKLKNQVTVVIVNTDNEDYELDIPKVKVEAAYETSDQNELKMSKPKGKLQVKARSVVTLTGTAR